MNFFTRKPRFLSHSFSPALPHLPKIGVERVSMYLNYSFGEWSQPFFTIGNRFNDNKFDILCHLLSFYDVMT